MRDSGAYSDDDQVQIGCLRFCHLLQEELNRVAQNWNLRHIRKSSNSECPHGQPDVLYFLPELTGSENYKEVIPEVKIELARDTFTETRPMSECEEEFKDLAHMIMEDEGLTVARNADDDLALYSNLLTRISDLM